MSDALKTVVFAFVLAVVCSLALTAASTGLKGFQRENALVDRQKNILKAVGAVDPAVRYTAAAIKALYREHIQCVTVDAVGRVVAADETRQKTLPLYLYRKDGAIAAYIVPIDSRGLWGRIYGYMAIDRDGRTVSGFSVYRHSETPGLGGEIESRWFQRNFVGKQIVDKAGHFVSVRIAKGAAADAVKPAQRANYVDGISGATMTGRYLSQGLHDELEKYEPVSLHFRREGVLTLPEKPLVCNPFRQG